MSGDPRRRRRWRLCQPPDEGPVGSSRRPRFGVLQRARMGRTGMRGKGGCAGKRGNARGVGRTPRVGLLTWAVPPAPVAWPAHGNRSLAESWGAEGAPPTMYGREDGALDGCLAPARTGVALPGEDPG